MAPAAARMAMGQQSPSASVSFTAPSLALTVSLGTLGRKADVRLHSPATVKLCIAADVALPAPSPCAVPAGKN